MARWLGSRPQQLRRMVWRRDRSGRRARSDLALVRLRLGLAVLRLLLLPELLRRLLPRLLQRSGLSGLPTRCGCGRNTADGELVLLRRSAGLLPLRSELQSRLAERAGCSAGRQR